MVPIVCQLQESVYVFLATLVTSASMSVVTGHMVWNVQRNANARMQKDVARMMDFVIAFLVTWEHSVLKVNDKE